MKFFYSISPVLMFIGFVTLFSGVILSVSIYSHYSQTMYALIGFGFITYVLGRIGVQLSQKGEKKESKE